jgi:hypothetical protein
MEGLMALDWAAIAHGGNKQTITAKLRKVLTGANYGNKPGQWTLTEMFTERSGPAETARQILLGIDDLGKSDGLGGVTDAETGQPLLIKLRVLTRQACKRAADGRGINDWDPTQTDAINANGEYCPAIEELPQPGDEVWIKGNALTECPVTGERMIRKHRLAARARLEAELGRQVKADLATYQWTRAKVDANGCITVGLEKAMQLISRHGKRVNMPQFSSGRMQEKNQRRITNWLFEECFDSGAPRDEAKQRTTHTR